MSMTRRSLLGLGASALAVPSFAQNLTFSTSDTKQTEAKNIIFLVADGMAIQTMSIADEFQNYVHGRRSYWQWLMNQDFAHTGLQQTASLTGVVTDSSAASSAWGSGQHIWNAQVNQYPDETKLTPISHIMSSAGVKVGLVTTTRITHATPAGFGVSVYDRDNEDLIATEYLTSGADVLMGGGSRHFDPTKRKDKEDVYAKFAAQGFKILKTREDLMAYKGGKVVGTFSSSHVPYSIDRDNDPEIAKTVPTLAEMTRAAIMALKDGPKGFLLQVEGGRVDHAGHANDLAGIVFDQIAFEEAVKVAVEFAIQDKNTLVVITTDHATGGPSLNGDGDEYFDTTGALRSFANFKASYEVMVPKFGKEPTAKSVAAAVEECLGYRLSGAEAVAIASGYKDDSPFAVSRLLGWNGGTMGAVLGNHSRVMWTSGNHTSDHCLVTAVGPGSEFFLGLNPNVSYFNHMLALKGLSHKNPTMSFEDALKAREARKASGYVWSNTVA